MDTDGSWRVHAERAALLSPANQNVSFSPNWKKHTFNYLMTGDTCVDSSRPMKGGRGDLMGSLSGPSVGSNIYKEYKEGHTHNWTILASISLFSRGPRRTAKASITLSTRGSSISPYALGSIFTRRTGRTGRSRITLEVTHGMTLLHECVTFSEPVCFTLEKNGISTAAVK